MQKKIDSKKYKKITISFTEADEDIVNYIEKLKMSNKASEFIREAIREKINNDKVGREINNDFIINKINNLDAKISNMENILQVNKFSLPRHEEDKNIEEKEDNIDIISERENVKEVDEDIRKALDFFDL